MKRPVFLILLFCSIQIIFWGISEWFGYSRPLFLIEYFFVLFALFKFGLRVAVVLLFPVLIAEVWLAVAQVYLLYKPIQWVYMLKYVGYLRADFLIGSIIFIILYLVVNFIFLKFVVKRNAYKPFLALFLLLVAINFLPSIGGFYDRGQKLYRDHSFRLLGSSGLMLFWIIDEPGMQIKADEFDDALTPWRGKNGESYKPILKADKTLLILVESWGDPKNPSEKNLQIKSLQAAGISIDINTTISTSGSTVSAEMRELCRLNNKSVVIEPNTAIFEDCLPNRARKLGYKTYSIHAASGGMYDRLDWYPKIGFEHSRFFGTIPEQGMRKCNSMPGLCDVDMVGYVFNQIQHENKVFYYWLTLNSHFPYDERDIFISPSLCRQVNLVEGEQRCRHFLQQQQFFNALASYIAAHKKELVGTQVIIVGDHNPPFYRDMDREAFHEDVVPLIAFTIN